MTAPRVEVNLEAIEGNTRSLVERLAKRGLAVTGVTKAVLGSPEVARAMLRGGVDALADSRIENLERLREAGITAPLMLLRSPTPAQADAAVAVADSSVVTDLAVIQALGAAAERAGTDHGIVIMIEMGDLREGVMPTDALDLARQTARTDHVTLRGVGTNLACRAGVIPGDAQMRQLSGQAQVIAQRVNPPLRYVSGGNSANLGWALGRDPVGRINDLRLGEAILLGTDPLTRQPLPDLRTDAFTLVGAVIESLLKPSAPWGYTAQAAYGTPRPAPDRGPIVQTIVALGRQDVDPDGLRPPAGVTVLAASSDHLVLETPDVMAAGAEIHFGMNYSALVSAMTSPFVATEYNSVPATV